MSTFCRIPPAQIELTTSRIGSGLPCGETIQEPPLTLGDDKIAIIDKTAIGVLRTFPSLQGEYEPGDVATEVAIRVLRNRDSFDSSKSQFSTWVYSITVRHCIDLIRKQENRRKNFGTQVEIDPFERNLDRAKFGATIVDDSPSSIGLHGWVAREIANLPELYRNLLDFYLLQGINKQEIANIQRRSLKTIQSAVLRGCRILQKRYIAEFGNPNGAAARKSIL